EEHTSELQSRENLVCRLLLEKKHTPAIAAFTVFQFLWVWNDLLVALTFAGGTPNVAPLTVRLAELSGSRGQDLPLLSAGAFVPHFVRLAIFLSGQRYFGRGLLAGGVEG